MNAFNKGEKVLQILVLAIIIALVDQGIKYYIQSHMILGMSIPIISNTLHITYILNPGAAFGLFAHQTLLLIAVAVSILATILYFYRYIVTSHWLLRLGTGVFTGGAVGNLIDRVKTGYVVDFVDFRIFPVFNSADIAIFFGVGCLMHVLLFVRDPLKNTPEPKTRA